MTRPQLETVPTYFRHYVEIVKDMDVLEALHQASVSALDVVRSIPESKGEHRYAEGKWSIKESLVHIMDVERVMAYRALRFARNDKTDLPGFDENNYALEANAHARKIVELADDMARLRLSTIDLFSSFSPEMLSREGTANAKTISVLNLGYAIAGHDIHHQHILKERYLTA